MNMGYTVSTQFSSPLLLKENLLRNLHIHTHCTPFLSSDQLYKNAEENFLSINHLAKVADGNRLLLAGQFAANSDDDENSPLSPSLFKACPHNCFNRLILTIYSNLWKNFAFSLVSQKCMEY